MIPFLNHFRRETYLNIAYLLGLGICIFLINRLTPLWADDFCRAGVHGIEVMEKAYYEYFAWSGRFFVLAQDYFLFSGSKAKILLFDICNSFIFIYLIILIFQCANQRFPSKLRDVSDLVFITALIVCLSESFSEVVFWKTGAINYLWGVTGELFVLQIFLSDALKKKYKAIWSYLFILFCFYIATYLEHLSVSVSIFLVIWFIDRKLAKKIIPFNYGGAIIAHILGSLLLTLAPGNFVRQNILQVGSPIYERVFTNFAGYKALIINNGWGLIAIFLAIILVAYKEYNEKNDKELGYFTSVRVPIFTGLSFLTAILLAAPGTTPIGRAAFPAEVFLAVAFAVMYGLRGHVTMADYFIAGISVLGLVVAASFILPNSFFIYDQKNYRDHLIGVMKKNGATFFTVPIYSLPGNNIKYPQWSFVRDITDNPEDWTNKCFVAGGIQPTQPSKIRGVSSSVFLAKEIALEGFGRIPASGREPSIFINQGNIYYQTNKSCNNATNQDQFFLHIFPEDISRIPLIRQPYGYDRLDFSNGEGNKVIKLNEDGSFNDENCVFLAKLPSYKIKSIFTGQYNLATSERYWSKRIEF